MNPPFGGAADDALLFEPNRRHRRAGLPRYATCALGVRAKRESRPCIRDPCALAEAGLRADALRVVLRQTVLVGIAHGLSAVANTRLVEDPVDVGLDGCAAEDELVGDLAVGEAGGDQLQYLDFAWRELVG